MTVSSLRRPLARQIKVVQWILPLVLFLVASGYETIEHILMGEESLSFVFGTEVFIFGILGPTAVWWVLGWAGQNQARLEQANADISLFNSELGRRVAERTTELAEKNAALEQANAELKELDKLKSEFVSLVSHELRAPLTNINGGIELIAREREALSPTRQEALDILRDESARLTKLVQNILDVSLLEAGRLSPTPGPLPLRPFLNQLLIGRPSPDASHKLTIEVPTKLQPAWVDETHLANVVVNLVDNAIKYSPEGGEVRVSARQGERGIILSVSDQGIGIPESEQPRLFERFYRGNNSTDREVYGHGLGLYFCHKLIEAQGGRIWVESEGISGHGTTFHLCLPLCPEGWKHEPDIAD